MHRRMTALAAAVLAMLAARPAAAAWSVDGSPLTQAPNNQRLPVSAPDGQGGAYVAWIDDRSNGNNGDLYAQHVNAQGAIVAGWNADGNSVCNLPSIQSNPAIASDGQGGAYLVWYDARNATPDVYAMRLASGGIAPGWPANGLAVCTAAGTQSNPVVCADGSGGALFAWSDLRGASEDIYVQHVLSAGAVDAAWPTGGKLLCGALQQQQFPTIVGDGAGGAIVAWEDGRNGGALTTQIDIYAGHMKSGAVVDSSWTLGGVALVIGPGSSYQQAPKGITDGAGGAIVAWTDQRNGNSDVYAMRIRANGTLAPGWTADGSEIVNTVGEQVFPVLVPDGAGGAVIAWQDGRDPSGFPTNTDVFALRVQGNGARASGWPLNGVDLSIEPNRQDAPAICGDGTGGALVSWTDGRPGADVYAQHVRGDGTRASGWPADGLPICQALDEQKNTTIVSDGAGGAICAWEDFRAGGTNHDIWAQRFFGSGQVGPVVGVDGPAPGGPLAVAFAGANPARGEARFAISLPAPADARAFVYNPAGRRVAVLWAGGARSAGPQVASWDGRDTAGRTAPPGVYAIEVLAGGQRAGLRFVFLP